MKIKSALFVLFSAFFLLTSCQPAAPTPTLAPTALSATIAPTLTATAIPLPPDVPVYRNSFEGIPDMAAGGITSSNAEVTTSTLNFNFPGPGTALQVKGTLLGEAYSGLAVTFSIPQLTGEDSLDLSTKTIGISFFIPPDSPIQDVDVIIRNGDKVVILGTSSGTGWIDYQLDVKNVYKNTSWTYTNVSGFEAREMIKRSKAIEIAGVRGTAGTPAVTAFYLDDLNWIGIDVNHVPVDNSVDSLRKAATNQHFKIGLFDNMCYIIGCPGEPVDPWFATTIVRESSIHAASFFPILQGQDYSSFDYSGPQDEDYVKWSQFGSGNSLTTVGYALGQWYNTVPTWVRALPFPDGTWDLLSHSMEKDLHYTKGTHPVWVLFNEAIQGWNGAIPNASFDMPVGLNNRQNSTGPASDCCYSPWSERIDDTSLIKKAFEYADGLDPDATLLFNSQSNEVSGWKVSDFNYQLTSGLKASGVPIDGVGFEMHNYITPDGRMKFWLMSPLNDLRYAYLTLDDYLLRVKQNVERYRAAGLKVAFTEMTCGIDLMDRATNMPLDLTTAAGREEYDRRLQWQAKYYTGLLKIAMSYDNVIMFRMWEVTDKYPVPDSVLNPGYGSEGIFDQHYHPKPAYYAMLDLLKNP